MRILLGVCGIGRGHSIRQTCILSELLKRDHKVALFTFGESTKYFKKYFPDVIIFEVSVPWIYADSNGIDFLKIAHDKNNISQDGYFKNFKAMDKVLKYFKSNPDLILTDYEPISAQLAYATCTPLVTIDQQSKYLGYNFSPFENFSPLEERSRLSLFFPKANMRFSCSFFSILCLYQISKYSRKSKPHFPKPIPISNIDRGLRTFTSLIISVICISVLVGIFTNPCLSVIR
ncbi:teichoic acid biosynthesis protein [Candidatus Magnetomorum sp. HK-1]|nr:teichoic acid biosynthesis protein [Candidatus Magnetomorum sp. HK-1]